MMRTRHTTRASATAPSWVGTCRGTRPNPLLTGSSLAESTVCSTWSAICGMTAGSSRHTGPSAVGPRCWTTATRSWTSLCSADRRNGRTRQRAGRGADTPPGPWAALPNGRPCGSGQAVVLPHSGRGSQPGTRTISDPQARTQDPLPITATDGLPDGSALGRVSRWYATRSLDVVNTAIPAPTATGIESDRDGTIGIRRMSGRIGRVERVLQHLQVRAEESALVRRLGAQPGTVQRPRAK